MTENNRSVPPSIPVQEAAPQGTNAWNVVNTGSLNAMSRGRGGGTGRRSFVSETVESDPYLQTQVIPIGLHNLFKKRNNTFVFLVILPKPDFVAYKQYKEIDVFGWKIHERLR